MTPADIVALVILVIAGLVAFEGEYWYATLLIFASCVMVSL